MPALKIVVVEDEAVIAENIAVSLRTLGYTVPDPALNYKDAVSVINREQPDLVMLDIRLNDTKDGIDLAQRLNAEFGIPFIFLTANADRATIDRAKVTEPAAYLIKPFTKADLYVSIEIAATRYKLHGSDKGLENFVFIKVGNLLRKTALHEITIIEAEHVYVNVYTLYNKALVRSSMAQMLEQLHNDPRFLQVHRSYSINLHHVTEVRPMSVMVHGKEIPVSKAHREELLKKIE